MIKKLMENMEKMRKYKPKKVGDSPYSSFYFRDVSTDLDDYRVLFWPNRATLEGEDDTSQYWVERITGKYSGSCIMAINCREFDSTEGMAYMILSAINLCKRA